MLPNRNPKLKTTDVTIYRFPETMSVSYDPKQDIAHICFIDGVNPLLENSFPFSLELKGDVYLIFDDKGVLTEIEVEDASKKFPNSILQQAKKI